MARGPRAVIDSRESITVATTLEAARRLASGTDWLSLQAPPGSDRARSGPPKE